MGNVKSTILRDGEVAIIKGDLEIIMNINTLFDGLCKLGVLEPVNKEEVELTEEDFEDAPAKQPTVDRRNPNNYLDGEVRKSETGGKFVWAFEFSPGAVDKTGNRFSGFVKRVKLFPSAIDAENFFDLSRGTVSKIAISWRDMISKYWTKPGESKAPINLPWYFYDRYKNLTYSAKIGQHSAAVVKTKHIAFVYLEDLPKNGTFCPLK